jgi:hypothetical protein
MVAVLVRYRERVCSIPAPLNMELCERALLDPVVFATRQHSPGLIHYRRVVIPVVRWPKRLLFRTPMFLSSWYGPLRV